MWIAQERKELYRHNQSPKGPKPLNEYCPLSRVNRLIGRRGVSLPMFYLGALDSFSMFQLGRRAGGRRIPPADWLVLPIGTGRAVRANYAAVFAEALASFLDASRLGEPT